MTRTISQEEFLGGGSFQIMTEEQIDKVEAGDQSLISRIREDIQKRGGQVAQATQDLKEDKVGPFRAGLRAAGAFAGSVSDAAGEVATSAFRALPDFVEKPIRSAGTNILQTDLGQKGLLAIQQGVDSYNEFKKENPGAAADLESVVNIAAVLPIGRVTKATGEALESSSRGVLGRAGTALRESGENVIQGRREAFVRELVRPQQTKKVREAQVARTTETGFGPFKRSEIAPSPREEAAERAVLSLEGIDPKGTVQRNYNVVQAANKTEAERLVQAVADNEFTYDKDELLQRLASTREEILRNPSLVGSDERVSQKLIDELERRITEAPNNGSGLLRVRKEYDAWVKSQKGANVFDPNRENAFSINNRELRKTINDFLDENAPNAQVKESLARQRALFNAMENMTPKAAIEADTALKRLVQRTSNVLGTKNKVVQAVAAAAGIGGLGAAATFAPAASVLGIGGFLTYQGGKIVMHPKVRKSLGDLVVELDSQIAQSGSLKRTAQIVTTKAVLQQLLEEYD